MDKSLSLMTMAKAGKNLTHLDIGKMTATKNMAKYYENARIKLLYNRPKSIQNTIINDPNSREAAELAHEVCKLAESWEYDGLDENGCDWENNYPF